MIKLCSVTVILVVFLWMKNDTGRVTATESCCPLEDEVKQDDSYIGVNIMTEGYQSVESSHESAVVPTPTTTTVAVKFLEIATVTETQLHIGENKTTQRSCDGVNQVTSVYERTHDIDMKFVQDSITSMWRTIFSLVFILILLAFLISYVYSLIKKNNIRKDTARRNEKIRPIPDTFNEKNSQLYFPIINASRTAHFLKDLDPIYDYPCSMQSDYEKV
ncbi:uncharacterized protein LOC135833039 [Planococcus citri]|uniref:uncharacterized protein LOC135833039 n=1 Tax=Planococcus citri TaxID=170843 RepID=UPI0031F89450